MTTQSSVSSEVAAEKSLQLSAEEGACEAVEEKVRTVIRLKDSPRDRKESREIHPTRTLSERRLQAVQRSVRTEKEVISMVSVFDPFKEKSNGIGKVEKDECRRHCD